MLPKFFNFRSLYWICSKLPNSRVFRRSFNKISVFHCQFYFWTSTEKCWWLRYSICLHFCHQSCLFTIFLFTKFFQVSLESQRQKNSWLNPCQLRHQLFNHKDKALCHLVQVFHHLWLHQVLYTIYFRIITFSSNHIHKSSCGLCFCAPDH